MSSNSVFTFQSLHSLYRKIWKLVRECPVRDLSSDRLATTGAQKEEMSSIKIQERVL